MTPGSMRAQGLYRSELAGIYGIVSTINALSTFHCQAQGSILIVCNGEATLTKSMKQWASNPLDKQFNIIHAIRAGMCKTKIKWSSKHIKGHQDQATLEVCNKARWNDAMDKVAKNHWEKYKWLQTPKCIPYWTNHGSYGWKTKSKHQNETTTPQPHLQTSILQILDK